MGLPISRVMVRPSESFSDSRSSAARIIHWERSLKLVLRNEAKASAAVLSFSSSCFAERGSNSLSNSPLVGLTVAIAMICSASLRSRIVVLRSDHCTISQRQDVKSQLPQSIGKPQALSPKSPLVRTEGASWDLQSSLFCLDRGFGIGGRVTRP